MYEEHDTKNRLYRIWSEMKRRCENSDRHNYRNYGGRGIKVCQEWKSSFETFREWALNNGYSDELSIDRIDNGGNYEPSNCHWVTDKEQANNKRSNKLIAYKGEKHTLAQWCYIFGLDYSVVYMRLYRNHLSFEEAIKKGNKVERKLTFKGKTQSMSEWTRELGFKKNTLYNRLNKLGWTVERALSTPELGYSWRDALQEEV